jgi:hypothetical protein
MGEDTQSASAGDIPREPAHAPAGHYRWVICGLLFFATMINYVDRYVLGVLAPDRSYELLFFIAAIVYVFSVVAIHVLSPRLEPVQVDAP